MQYQDITRSALAATLAVAVATAAADGPATGKPADSKPLDKAFDALKTYDLGKDRKPLQAIDDAVHRRPR